MPHITFTAALSGREIVATFTPDSDITAPVWCFSLLAPGRVINGGTWVTGTGGYCEILLPDLIAGQTHSVTIAYAGDFIPTNRAWLPLGSYFRFKTGDCVELPALPQGVILDPSATLPPENPRQALRLVPQPAEMTLAADQPPVALRMVHIIDADAAQRTALEAADALSRRCGFGALLDAEGTPLTIAQDASLASEAYRLTIAGGGVTLHASDSAGIFYGAVTLITLIQTHDGHIPATEIADTPRYPWRGQHLDCARHFFAVETIERLLDMMALMKLNRLHWHFADDEAFRLEVDCHPDLWRKTAYRGEGELVPAVFGASIRAGGSYSKADVARLIAHARALQIEIMPEIELPAHALALTRAFPQLRDPNDTGSEISIQGYAQNALNPAMPAVMDFLRPLIAELADIFPFPVLHLGCDELAPDTWAGSPAARALCDAEGLVGRDDLQGWFMEKVGALCVSHGLRPAAWEEAAKGANDGIGNGALLFSWTGQAHGIAAARAGYDVIMCPAQHCYLDMAHSPASDDWGASWAAIIALEDTLDWRVVPEGADDIAPRIKGVQGAYWGEFTTDDRQIEPMLAPRILGIALKAWSPEGAVLPADLPALAQSYARLFASMGWHAHPAAQRGR